MSKQNTRKRSVKGRRNNETGAASEGPVWLWGSHAVQAARDNPNRTAHRLVATANAARRLEFSGADILAAADIDRLLPAGAVHQGVALLVDPLEICLLDDLIASAVGPIVVLDQVSDPHNLGAIFRTAAAFGAAGLVLQTRHAPAITGIVAKTAAGGIEHVPECRVVNIARTLDQLAAAGFNSVGLAGEAPLSLADAVANSDKIALVLGAEGSGLRPAVAKACTVLARVSMSPVIESLNVSNAAAIALHMTAKDRFS